MTPATPLGYALVVVAAAWVAAGLGIAAYFVVVALRSGLVRK